MVEKKAKPLPVPANEGEYVTHKGKLKKYKDKTGILSSGQVVLDGDVMQVAVPENKSRKSEYNKLSASKREGGLYLDEKGHETKYELLKARSAKFLKKTILTQETFEKQIYRPGKTEGTVVPYQNFFKCVFIGCDFSKMPYLHRSMFVDCVFIDNNFHMTEPYNSMFMDCKFENNDFSRAKMRCTQFSGCEFCGDNFENSVWRSRYFNKPEDTRVDVDRSEFIECSFKEADLGVRTNDVKFSGCYGPAKTTLFLDQRFGYDPSAYGKQETIDQNVAMLHGNKPKLEFSKGRAPSSVLSDTQLAHMEAELRRLEADEIHLRPSRRRPWANLEGLKNWIRHCDTRYAKTEEEYRRNNEYLSQFLARDDRKDRYIIVTEADGSKHVERNVAKEILMEDEMEGGRSRGSRSIGG